MTALAGDPDAIVDVVMDASRHIVSTTVTTFGGFLPLILEGSQFWPPFAMAIAGGVLLSTLSRSIWCHRSTPCSCIPGATSLSGQL
jgi:multidrug efflux pump subunit AcrB